MVTLYCVSVTTQEYVKERGRGRGEEETQNTHNTQNTQNTERNILPPLQCARRGSNTCDSGAFEGCREIEGQRELV